MNPAGHAEHHINGCFLRQVNLDAMPFGEQRDATKSLGDSGELEEFKLLQPDVEVVGENVGPLQRRCGDADSHERDAMPF
ncbi:MAG: hypothetical protein A2107_11300 [Verrucomicrobia bacterium GWF2_62_7]|nr:MAG: hypothetical protein A2107_11300 [Verrucomicrobia bacterium GWF2_62_7]